jgi:hypothetical protein
MLAYVALQNANAARGMKMNDPIVIAFGDIFVRLMKNNDSLRARGRINSIAHQDLR